VEIAEEACGDSICTVLYLSNGRASGVLVVKGLAAHSFEALVEVLAVARGCSAEKALEALSEAVSIALKLGHYVLEP